MSHFESFYHSQGNFYSDHLSFVKIIKSVPLEALEECDLLPGAGDADGCRSSTRKRGIEVNDEEQVGFVEEILGNIFCCHPSNCRGGSKGSGSRGSGRSNHPSGDDGDGGIGGSGIRTDKPPCVGLCYYNKLHGIPQESTTPRCEFTVSWSN